MITNETEFFTADEARELELYEAIKRGETKFSGRYEVSKNNTLDFKQQNFVFTDNRGNLRVGKFRDIDEVLKFMDYVRVREAKQYV